MFGNVVVDKYDLPSDMREWARIPDYGIWFKDPDRNKWMHRFTLHGMGNVDKAIKIGRERELILYDKEYKSQILTMVVSHTFLDVFNCPILPSYPSSRSVKFTFKRIKAYSKIPVSIFKKGEPIGPPDPDEGWEELFREWLEEHGHEGLRMRMVKEHNALPMKRGQLVNDVLSLYEKD